MKLILKKLIATLMVSFIIISMNTFMLNVSAKDEKTQKSNKANTSDVVKAKSEKKHTVTFVSNGGSYVEPQEVEEGEYIDTSKISSQKPGYQYVDWCIDEELTIAYNFNAKVTKDITLYARWTNDDWPENFMVVFDSNGGTPIDPVIVKNGNKVKKPDPDPTKKGYVFAYWAVINPEPNIHGSKNLNHEEKFSEENTYYRRFDFDKEIVEDEPDLILHAVWDVACNVKFDSNGGSAVPEQNIKYGSCATEPNPEPIKEGYKFIGWYVKKYEPIYPPSPVIQQKKVNLGMCEPQDIKFDFSYHLYGNIELVAHWEANIYDVTFDPNGGTPAPNKQEVKYGEHATEPKQPIKEGYEFAGWYIEGNTNPFDFKNEEIKGNTTLKAHWLCTVTFVPNNGQENFTQKVEEGTLASKPNDPTYEGHTFEGWYSDEALTQAFDFNNTVVEKNMNLYAKWSETKAADQTNNNDNNDSAKSVLTGQSLAMIWTFVAIALVAIIAICATVFYRKKHKN